MSRLEDFSDKEDESMNFDEKLLELIYSYLKELEWDIVGIIDREEDIYPLPKESRVVTSIIENKALKLLQKLCDDHDAELIPADHTRQYPDSTLKGGIFDDLKIAFDIKTGRIKKNKETRLNSSLTIGSYAGYFIHPNEKRQGCREPYGDFDRHWIAAYLYDWRPSENTEDMVKIRELIVKPKWKLASKSSGTGTTKHIGSVTNINELKNGVGSFKCKEDFERYWREKGRNLK